MKNKEEREKNNIKKITLSVSCGMTSSNLIHVIRVPNRKKTLGRKERQKKKLEEITTKNFPNLIKIISLYMQRDQQMPSS